MQSEWIGDGGISKDLLYGELVQGKRLIGRPHLRYKDVCLRDSKAMGIPGKPSCHRANSVEADSAEEPLPVGRVTCPTERNKETENEGPKLRRQSSIILSLHSV